MTHKISIKLKVTLWYTLVMVALSAVVLAAMISLSQRMINQDIANRITRTVSDSARRLVGPNGQLGGAPEFRYYEQGVHMALYDADYNLLDGEIPFDFADEVAFISDFMRTYAYDGDQYYIYDQEIRFKNRPSMWLRGVVSVSDESYTLRSVTKTNLILTLTLIIVASAGGYFIIRRAFVPVDKISQTAKRISESSDLSQRIALGNGKDEIYRLANTFDEMLEKIEQTLEREKQFTSDASHELRTPVAVILSECEYALECAKDVEECRESVQSVKRQAEKMSKLLSELLMISRMDYNTQQTNFERLDVSELLTFVCEEQVEIHDGSITLTQDIAPHVTAEADRFLLTRLFINLISNAYQYGRENGRIQVSLTENQTHLISTVSDDGIGIAPEDLPKIWERFYQADPARTSNENGSMGLGLSMVRWIAACHKGTVEVQSTPGKGTTFTFTMPKKIGG